MARAPASPTPGQLDADKGTLAVPTDKRIFLSHASADKALADLLRNASSLAGSRKREEAATQIGNIQMGVLNTDTEISEIFDELHDRIAQHLGIQTKLTAWNRAIRDFKQQLPPKLAAAQSAAAAQSSSPKVNAAIATAGTEDDKITIGNISLTAGARGKELHAEATNHDAIEHSAIIKATFYEAEGGIIGTSDATVQQLVAGRTKTFSMHDLPLTLAAYSEFEASSARSAGDEFRLGRVCRDAVGWSE